MFVIDARHDPRFDVAVRPRPRSPAAAADRPTDRAAAAVAGPPAHADQASPLSDAPCAARHAARRNLAREPQTERGASFRAHHRTWTRARCDGGSMAPLLYMS